MRIFDEALACVFVGGAERAIGMVPIHQGIVKAEAQAFRAGGFDVFTNEIAAGSLFWGAVFGQLGVEVAEAFVMLGSHHHVFLPGLFGEPGPSTRGIWFRLEALGELLVFGYGNAFVFHHPFVAAEHAVQAPMDEHAKSRFVPPLHAASPVGVFRGGAFLCLRLHRSCACFRGGGQGKKRRSGANQPVTPRDAI